MATKLISFRLTEDAIAALKLHKKTGESINLTAQRLLTDLLGVPAKVATSSATASALAVNNVVDNVVNSEYFREALADTLASVIASQNGKNAEIEQTVEKLGEAVQHLTARVNSLLPVGNIPSSESVESDNETDDGQDIPSDAVGVKLEDTDTLTPDTEATPAVMGLTDADDGVVETETAVENTDPAEQSSAQMLGEVLMAERLKIAVKYLRNKIKELKTAEAFTTYYRKKTREKNICWDYTEVGGAYQFYGFKEVEAAQDTPLFDLIEASA